MNSSHSLRRVARALACSAVGGVVMGNAAGAPGCMAAPAKAVLERFTSAACESCWQTAQAPGRPGGVLVLDWIVPAGDGAPLAAAALAEASARSGNAPSTETLLRRVAVNQAGAPRVRIADGPGWNGYVGLSLAVTRAKPLPAGAVAYMALVERVPAGSEGSPVARQLVRAVVGPLPLGELATQPKVQYFRATRLPEAARPERLGSVGWVESAQGAVLAAAQSPTGPCSAAK